MGLPTSVEQLGDDTSAQTSRKRRRWFGILALILGLVAVSCSIVSYHVLEDPFPQKSSKLTINLGFVKWERESKPPPPDPDLSQWVSPHQLRLVAITLAFFGACLSITSWVKREGFWMGFGGCVLAAAAVAWVWFIIVFAVLLLSGGFFAFIPPAASSRAD